MNSDAAIKPEAPVMHSFGWEKLLDVSIIKKGAMTMKKKATNLRRDSP